MVRGLVAALLFVTVVGGNDDTSCAARTRSLGTTTIEWLPPPDDQQPELERWCRAVGTPVIRETPDTVLPPTSLDELVVVSWNAHLGGGRLADLIGALRDGSLTGAPVSRFVLLVQELFRRGDDIPAFETGARTAHAIRARDSSVADVNSYVASLGLSLLYVPAMRNGADAREDRGNAILSTEPLANAIGFELPLARQRRVMIGATIPVVLDGNPSTLRVVNAHLEPLSSPASLWFFRNPRARQMAAVLDRLSMDPFTVTSGVGAVLGGDFNTVKDGDDERAYEVARAWGRSTRSEDKRATHFLGRLDYIVFRLADGWSGATRRADEKFGSDHYPVIGTFRPATLDKATP